MASEPTTLSEGQKLWYVPSDSRWSKPREVIVQKIGRKWATLAGNHGRVDMETLLLDGGGYSSPGRCWFSQGQHEEWVRAERAWRQLSRKIGYQSPPPGLTEEAVIKAAALLGIQIGESA